MSPGIRSGLFELDHHGRILFSRFKKNNGVVETILKWRDTSIFEQLAGLNDVDDLRRAFGSFVSTGRAADSFTVNFDTAETPISFEIMILRVFETGAALSNEIMIMEIKRHERGH